MNDIHIHINRPTGYYIGQVRRHGARRWQDVTGRCKSTESALSLAASDMDGFHRARVLFIDASGYYDPRVVTEAKRK